MLDYSYMNFINGYERYLKVPNTICKSAKVYTKTFFFNTKNEFKNRLVRVYLPSTYDFSNPNQRFPVLYMLDGKNLFDDYTSFVGEWGIDESIEEMIVSKKNRGYIVVGIDAPNSNIDRTLEMTPSGLNNLFDKLHGGGYADILAKFIFDEVKPDIDKTFYTLIDKEHTGVGGSSMGGLMSFYLGVTYPDRIKYCLNFSPAFFLFKWKDFEKYLDKVFSIDLPKMYFYVGGIGFESEFVDSTYKTYDYFLAHGFKKEDTILVHDPNKEHNEKAWREYFPSALLDIDK